MSKRKLTRIQFFAIKRELVNTERFQADIAADYGVSSSLVSLINQTGTWENYLTGKRAAAPLRKPVKAPSTQTTAAVTPKRPLNQEHHFERELKSMSGFRAEREIARLNDRLNALTAGIHGLYRNPLFRLLFMRSVYKGVDEFARKESHRGGN